MTKEQIREIKQDKWCMDKAVNMEPWQRANVIQLLDALGGEGADIIQTESEASTLCWLAGWDDATILNMCAIFNRLRGAE